MMPLLLPNSTAPLHRICRQSRLLAGAVCFPLRQCHAVDYVQQGIALVGDAAHSIHPLAGQGVNLGLKDVAVLVEELGRAWQQESALGSELTLRRYQRRRKTDNLLMMSAMEAFKRGFGSTHPAITVARNMGFILDRCRHTLEELACPAGFDLGLLAINVKVHWVGFRCA